MDLADFIQELPITLANWHSASCRGVPVTSHRSLSLFEYDYLDTGGSGIFIHRPDSSSVKWYQLKCDAMGSSPFYPKCFTLPMVTTNKDRYRLVPTDFVPNRNHCNSLMYDDKLECFFSADPITNRLDLFRLDKDEESPALSKLNLISSTSSLCQSSPDYGPICEISSFKHKPNSDDLTFAIRQPKQISLCHLKEENDQLIISISPINFYPGDRTLGQLVNKFDGFTEFWKLSKSHLLQNSLAIGQYGEDDSVTLSDYNLETNQFLWVCKSSRTDFKGKLTWQSPVGLSWVRDHPKLLAYCELSQFGLLDTRDRSSNSMLSIMDRKKLQFARDWEKFRGLCQLSISEDQFLISMDHKVILVDRRFPQKNLLTWCHMLRCSVTDLPHFLSSTSLTNSTESIITLANKSQACLMTVNPFEVTNIIQPHSLHMPLHLSQPIDCWHYSPNSMDDIRQRLENSTISGLIVIPGENGYSVCQSTVDNSIYVQEFYPSSTIEPEHRVNWKRSCLMENLPIPDGVDSLLESAFENIQSTTGANESDEVVLKTIKRKIMKPKPSTIRPKFLMPLPGSKNSRNGTQSMSEQEEEEEQLTELVEQLISKRVNLLTDVLGSIQENPLTMKLLSKWRDDTDN